LLFRLLAGSHKFWRVTCVILAYTYVDAYRSPLDVEHTSSNVIENVLRMSHPCFELSDIAKPLLALANMITCEYVRLIMRLEALFMCAFLCFLQVAFSARILKYFRGYPVGKY
jgi:hypothetical protein